MHIEFIINIKVLYLRGVDIERTKLKLQKTTKTYEQAKTRRSIDLHKI